MSSYSSPLFALILAGILALGMISYTVPGGDPYFRDVSGAKFVSATHQASMPGNRNALTPFFTRVQGVIDRTASYFQDDEELATAQDLPAVESATETSPIAKERDGDAAEAGSDKAVVTSSK
ncbi:MAG: hypothetical protein P8X50_02260 [Maritimibacter sp.]